ncbi:MAG: hypothetical protein ACXABY_33695 [Candidatus Thorarchaeota archaeon]|jgi:hypothetical protein
MAITTSGVTIENQDGTGTWSDWGSGGGSSTNTDVFLTSTGSRARKISNGNKGMGYSLGGSFDYTGKVVAVRYLVTAGISTLRNKDAGGIYIRLRNSVTDYDYYVDGSNTYSGGWKVAVIDLSLTSSTNTFPIGGFTSLNNIGVGFNQASAVGGGDPNCYIDSIISFEKVTIGGTTNELFLELLAADEAGGWGLVEERSGVYYCKALFELNNAGINSTDEVVVFENPTYWKDGLPPTFDSCLLTSKLGISTTASAGGDFGTKLTSTSGSSGITTLGDGLRYTLNLSNDYDAYGCTFSGSSNPQFGVSKEVLSTTFNDCLSVSGSSATFRSCNFIGSTDTGAYDLTSSSDIQSCNFISNSNAIETPSAGTFSLTDVVFTSNTVDINNTSLGSVTINASGTSNPTTTTGLTTIVNSKQLTLTNLQNPSEVRVYQTGTPPLTELAGQEDVITGSYSTNIDAATYPNVTVTVVNNEGYQNVYFDSVSMSTDREIFVSQPLDRQDVD